VHFHSDGLINLVGAQVDTVVVEAVPTDVLVDVAVRVVGVEKDFTEEHSVEVVLTAPDMVELGRLAVPLEVGVPLGAHIPGYELNRHCALRIMLPADTIGGYDLAFSLDGAPAHEHRTTISVVLKA
jgi:hypothetical protein